MQIITHNMSADNANRQLGIVCEGKKKTTEKLATGYRINRSADDAAGLSISEKMRRQIRGLNKASRNIQDGVSLIQTADGALSEVHDILQRMNELAAQGANDTNTNSDRGALQAEVNQLKSEINRISKTTQFNTHTILMAKQLVEIETDDYAAAIMNDRFSGMGNRTGYVYGKNLDFSNVNAANKEKMIGKRFYVTCSQNCSQTFTFRFNDQQTSSITLNGDSLSVEIGIKDASINSGADIVAKIYDLIVSKQADFIRELQATRPGWSNHFQDTIIGHANAVAADGANITFYSILDRPPYMPGMGEVRATDLLETEMDFHIQVNDNPYQEIALNLKTINSATLGLGTPDVTSFESAGKALDSIHKAIGNLSSYRSYLGAMQNRLEKTMKIVDYSSENTQRAESLLRDADMAKETVRFSKDRVLEQFGQAMLAHTNQDADGVRSLLDSI